MSTDWEQLVRECDQLKGQRAELQSKLDAVRAALAEAEKERDELKHDIERHVAICSSQATELSEARAQLEQSAQKQAGLREALECLRPGLILDLRYASDDDDKDALRSRVDTVERALIDRQ